MSYIRTSEDLWRAFSVQKQALTISSLAFDGGMIGEAVRLANACFMLVGRGMRSHTSILDQLNILDEINYFRTSLLIDSNSGTPLIEVNLEHIKNGEYIIELQPRGKNAFMNGRMLDFKTWWNEIVLKNPLGSLSREQIIRVLRDKDGGAHFDKEIIDHLIIDALKGNIGGFYHKVSEDEEPIPVPFSLENTMRQIAEELIFTIRYIEQRYI